LDLGLTDKVAFVAGSTRGIGRTIADAFLREGSRVGVSGRTKHDLDRTSHELESRFGRDHVLATQGDLTQKADIEKSMRAVGQRWGGLDCLVVNVGSGRGRMGWEADTEEWNRLLNLNLIAGSLMADCAVPFMQGRNEASIIFISSLAGMEVLPAPIAYACAKSGVVALSKMLSRALAPERIRVNTVAPGNILFPGGVWQRKLEEDPQGVHAYIAAEVPMKRMGAPEEVADAVTFLASARASFITGACLLIDGGQSHAW
jgi:3-oxoacyl-[acyl-carrier protein] reductase